MTEGLVIEAIKGLREDINRNHVENRESLKRSDLRQDKLEGTLNSLASNMSTLAISMSRLEEVQERIEKDNENQRAVDEKQNVKLEQLGNSWHEMDKKLDALKNVPDEIKENRHNIRDVQNQVKALIIIQDGHEDKIKESIKELIEIKEIQAQGSAKLNSINNWSKWFKEKILPPLVLLGVPAAIIYWINNK